MTILVVCSWNDLVPFCIIDILLSVSFPHFTVYLMFSFSLLSSFLPFPIDRDWCELMTEKERAPASPGCATNQWTNPVSVRLSLSSTCCWSASWMDGLGSLLSVSVEGWGRDAKLTTCRSAGDGSFYLHQPCSVRDTIVEDVICSLQLVPCNTNIRA
jgi:hypothetical protein